jgi:hypothetical protein
MSTIMRKAIDGPSLKDTICKTEKWNKDLLNKVDWKAYGKVFQSISNCRRISMTKISHKLLNTNYQNKKFYGQPDTCPCCNQAAESFDHLLSCPSDSNTLLRAHRLEQLQNDLEMIGTPKIVTHAVIHGITQIHPSGRFSNIPSIPQTNNKSRVG